MSKEDSMAAKYLSRGVVIVVLGMALAVPAKADLPSKNEDIGILVGIIATAVVITVVVMLEVSKDRTITGCVRPGEKGMTITGEKDNQVYVLSGNTVGITAGDRMKLKGKKAKSKGRDQRLVWVSKNVAKDYGVCHP
jgi:hypothetical protein